MTFHYFGGLLWKAFPRGQLLSNRVILMTFHYFGWLLWEAFRQGHKLGNQVTFHDFSLLRGYFVKPSVGDSCLVTGLPLTTFHYFVGLLWRAFLRGQLLSSG